MEHRVSVIMTVKNGREFIRKAVRSVLEQTRLPYELVIVDDGSVDDTKHILEGLAADAAIPLRFIETGGIGRAHALNLAVEKADGEWIANLDVDDFWYPEKLQAQLAFLSMRPDAKIVTTESRVIIKGEQEGRQPEPLPNLTEYRVLKEKAFYFRNPVNHSSVLFSKAIFRQVGGYNSELDRQIDFDLWLRFLLRGHLFYQLSARLTAKVLHEQQSFEAANIFLYRWSDMTMKYRGLSKQNVNPIYYLLPLVYLIGAFLPRRIKRLLNKDYWYNE